VSADRTGAAKRSNQRHSLRLPLGPQGPRMRKATNMTMRPPSRSAGNRGVGAAVRLEVAKELVGAVQQVARDDDPDPPVVEDDADQTEELRDEETKAIATDVSGGVQ